MPGGVVGTLVGQRLLDPPGFGPNLQFRVAAALLVGDRIATAFARGGWTFVHGETQAGTPACAAAVLAVIDELRRIDVEATTQALASTLHRLARTWQEDGIVTDVSGSGCFVGVEFRRGGQWNYPGRYPVHWFQNPDPRGSLLADCVIHQSYQRGVVATGTCQRDVSQTFGCRQRIDGGKAQGTICVD